MNRLANVELQLVMHGLDTQTRIRFARCSRQLVNAVDSAFAWKYALPLDQFTASTHKPPSSPSVRYLSRHIPLKVLSPIAFLRDVGSLSDPHHHHPIYTVRELDARPLMSQQEWQQMFSYVQPGAIGIIRVSWSSQPRVFHPALCTNLHTLQIDGPCVGLSEGAKDMFLFESLPMLPALTSLNVSLYTAKKTSGLLEVVSRCPRLTRLCIDGLYAVALDHLSSLLSAPLMQQNLQFLSITRMEYYGRYRDEALGRAFASMQELRTLHCCCTNTLVIHTLATNKPLNSLEHAL